MMASCVVLGVEARMAKTDAVLLATVVIGQAALAQLYLSRDQDSPMGRAAWTLPLLFWVPAGLGILIKGPIVLLVSGSTLLVLALWDRKAAWMKRLKPLAGLGIVLAIAAPWLIAIAIKTNGAFFAESVGHDMLGKVAGGQEGKGLPPGYYLGSFWITFAPWSFLALLAVPWVWAKRRDDAVRFCIAWIVPSWLVFEAVPTKLLHYTLPVFPAIAALAAAALMDRFGRTQDHPRRVLTALAVGLGGLGFGALTLAVAALPYLVDGRIDPVGLALVPAVAGLFALSVRGLLHAQHRSGILAGLAAAGLLYAGTYGAVLPGINGIWISRQAAQAVAAARPCPNSVVASAGYSEPSSCLPARHADQTGRRRRGGGASGGRSGLRPGAGGRSRGGGIPRRHRFNLRSARPDPLGRDFRNQLQHGQAGSPDPVRPSGELTDGRVCEGHAGVAPSRGVWVLLGPPQPGGAAHAA